MKRILCILLALLMLAPAAYADSEKMTYRLSAESGKIGDTVKVVVSVEDAPAIISYESILLYDPAVLKPTGTYQKMNMGGMMAFNPNYTSPVEGMGAVKVAAFGTNKTIIEGDMDLFNFTFEIIDGSTDEKGTKISIHNHSFSQNDAALTKVPALTIIPCYVGVPFIEPVAPDAPEADTPDAPSTEEPAPDAPSTDEPSADAPSADEPTKDEPQTDAPATPEVEEEKKPTGDWYFDPDSNQAVLVEKDEAGKDVLHQYTTEYEKDEEGKTTGVILYDEDEKEAGKLTVNEDEYGNITVIEQDMKKPFSWWFLLPIGAAVLIAAGAVALAISEKRKAKHSKKKNKKK